MSCESAIKVLFRDKLSEEQVNTILSKLKAQKAKNPKMSETDLLEGLLKEQHKQLLKEQRFLNSQMKIQEISSFVSEASAKWGEDESVLKDALYSMLSDNGRFPRMSLESSRSAIVNEYFNVFQVLEKEGFFRLMKDKQNAPAFSRELAQGVYELGFDIKPKFTNKLVERAAYILHGLNKKRLMDLQAEGFDIENLKGYVFSGFFKPEIVRKTPFDVWLSDTLDAIDLQKQAQAWDIELTDSGIPNEEIIDRLKQVYESISQGDVVKSPEFASVDALTKAMKDPDALNKKVSSHRELHYKDGTSYANYFEKYSGRNILDSIRRDITSTATTLATSRTFGITPEITIEYGFKAVNDILAREGKPLLSKSFKDDYKGIFNVITGRSSYSENWKSRTTLATKKIAQNALLMKTALKVGLLDPTVAALNLSSITGDNYYSTYARYMSTYVKTILSPSDRVELAKHFDLIGSLVMDEFHTELNGNAFERGLTKLTAFSAKIAMIPYQTMAAKTATAYHASMSMHRTLNAAYEGSEHGYKRLLDYGFTPRELSALKAAGETDLNGAKIISGDFLRDNTPENLRLAFGNPKKNVTQFSTKEGEKPIELLVDYTDDEILQDARRLSQKLGAYMNDHANLGSPTPTAVNHYQLTGGRTPDTVSGAALHLIMQFKAFAAAVYRVHRHVAYSSGIKEQNIFKQYMRGNNGAIGHAVLTSTVLGSFLLMMDDILQGKTPRDPTADPIKFVADSLIKGGSAGLLVDYALNDYERGRTDIITDAAGPVASMVKDAAYLISDMKRGLDPTNKDDERILPHTARFVRKWMPMANYYGVQMLMNTQFAEGLNMWIDPKYNRSRKKKMRENSGMLYSQQPLFGD